MSREEQLLLGIDTGGTYTDAVLFNHLEGVLEKAKSLTTKHDLSIGISGAVDCVLGGFGGSTGDIAMVSISTTLATNALVEGKGGSVALVMIGFEEADMNKAGLREALSGDPVIFIRGGHDVQGNETALDMSPLDGFLEEHAPSVSGFAVVGMFAVINASHELAVKEYLTSRHSLSCTCSHELSSKLGGPKRALTTVLNARLVPIIRDLVEATRRHLSKVHISAPLMVVRGDGALVSADFALNRPIETILSGPAASLIGAKYLLGSTDAVISDIGGTTTDVAILEKGWPRIAPEGAVVGGFATMVEAVAMHSFGLGGDSVVHQQDNSRTGLLLGPRRQIPVSLVAMDHPQIVFPALERQLGLDNPGTIAGQFGWTDLAENQTLPLLKATEEKLLARMTQQPQALDKLLKGSSEIRTLNRLISRGLVQVSGFTPSDAMHVLGLQENWDAKAAAMVASLFARQKDRFGRPIADTVETLCKRVKDQLTRQSADAVIQSCMKENGIEIGPGAAALIQRALDGSNDLVEISVKLDRTLVGLGASASKYYPDIGRRLATDCKVPEHADVANAIGAVAGDVRVQRSLLVSSSDGGSSFQVLLPEGLQVFISEQEAIDAATAYLGKYVLQLADEAGAEGPDLTTELLVQAPEIEGSRYFVQANITATATGLPKISGSCNGPTNP